MKKLRSTSFSEAHKKSLQTWNSRNKVCIFVAALLVTCFCKVLWSKSQLKNICLVISFSMTTVEMETRRRRKAHPFKIVAHLTLEARCGHFLRLLKFSVSYFRCCCNLLRYTPWLFLTYDKVFATIGIFLLELLETEYFTHLRRSPERSKMTCAWSGYCFFKNVVRSFSRVSFVTMSAVTQQWSYNWLIFFWELELLATRLIFSSLIQGSLC